MYKKNCNTRKWMYLCAVTGVMNLLAFYCMPLFSTMVHKRHCATSHNQTSYCFTEVEKENKARKNSGK